MNAIAQKKTNTATQVKKKHTTAGIEKKYAGAQVEKKQAAAGSKKPSLSNGLSGSVSLSSEATQSNQTSAACKKLCGHAHNVFHSTFGF